MPELVIQKQMLLKKNLKKILKQEEGLMEAAESQSKFCRKLYIIFLPLMAYAEGNQELVGTSQGRLKGC